MWDFDFSPDRGIGVRLGWDRDATGIEKLEWSVTGC